MRRAAVLVALTGLACTPAAAPPPKWPALAQRWYDRATESYRTTDFEDAAIAADNALRLLPKEPEVRVLCSRIALAGLEFDRALQLLDGVAGNDARAVRGRAYWYSGKVDHAADELESLLTDPEIRDTWAQQVSKLARRGSGRVPFRMSGAMLAAVEMPQVAATALVVPLEINGEPALGMIATNSSEVVVDSQASAEPSWVSLRFGEKLEVRDVPALAKDLSGLSKQLDAPIKTLLGVNLLRHLHPTVDFAGGQFVVRSFDPPAPPAATTVKLSYVRGGGMLIRSQLGAAQTSPMASFLIDTSMSFPIALDEHGWQKAGIDVKKLRVVPTATGIRQGTLPLLRLGAFELPHVPGIHGAPVAELEQGLDVDLDGLMGSGLLAAFRVTLVDGGRTMWLEDMPAEAVAASQAPGILDTPVGDTPDSSDAEAPADAPVPDDAQPPPPGSGKKALPKAPTTPKKAPPAPDAGWP